MAKLLSDTTAARLKTLLNKVTIPVPPKRGNASKTWNPVLVRALDDTAIGGDVVGDQCYSGEVVKINSLVDDQAVGASVWLTVLSAVDTATAPAVDAIYNGLYAGRFDPDPGGAGTDSRPRVFAVPVGSSAAPLTAAGPGLSSLGFSVVADDTFEASGITRTLPSAGTYLIWAETLSQINVSALGGPPNLAFIYGMVRDNTAAGIDIPITGVPQFFVNNATVVNVVAYRQAFHQFVYVASGANTLELFFLRPSGPTWTDTTIDGVIGYLKIG